MIVGLHLEIYFVTFLLMFTNPLPPKQKKKMPSNFIVLLYN